MKNTILLSIDVFNPNNALLKYGIYTAKNMNATLMLFDAHFKTVVIPSDYSSVGNSTMEIANSEIKIEEAKRKLADVYKSISEEWHFTKAKLVTDSVPNWKGEKEMYLISRADMPHNVSVMNVTYRY